MLHKEFTRVQGDGVYLDRVQRVAHENTTQPSKTACNETLQQAGATYQYAALCLHHGFGSEAFLLSLLNAYNVVLRGPIRPLATWLEIR